MYTPNDGLHDIILPPKMKMPIIMIPVTCRDPFVPNELECVVSPVTEWVSKRNAIWVRPGSSLFGLFA